VGASTRVESVMPDCVPRCIFYVQFAEKGRTAGGSNPNGRSFNLAGGIWNTDDRRLNGKRISLQVYRGNWPAMVREREEKWAQKRGAEDPTPFETFDGAIGTLKILKNVESEFTEFEDDDGKKERHEIWPFDALVFLDQETYEAVEKACDDASANGRIILATLTVASRLFPDEVLRAADLDYSQEIQCQVIGIEFTASALAYCPASERAVRVPKWRVGAQSFELGVRLHNIQVSYLMPESSIKQLECEGTIQARRNPQLHGRSCGIIFSEYDRDERGRYPVEAFSGYCSFEPDGEFVYLELRYRRADLDGPLRVLIETSESGTAFILVTVLADIEEVNQLRPSEMRADISSWQIHVSRSIRPRSRLEDEPGSGEPRELGS
jgi:hypothetical protein